MKSFKHYHEDAGGAGGAAAVGIGTTTLGASGTGDNPDKTVPVSKKMQKKYTSVMKEQEDPDAVEQLSKHKATPASVKQRLVRHKIANERETEHSLRKRADIVKNIPNIGTVPSSASSPRKITGAVNMESFADFHKKSKIKVGTGVGPQTFMTKEAVESGNKTYGYHGTVEAKDDADRAKKYSKMHKYVKKVAMAAGHLQDARKPNVMVKHFLDSPHGRHVADNPTDHNITSRFRQFKKSYDPQDFAESFDLEEGSAAMDAAGDRIEKAMKDGNFKEVIKNTSTPHLRGLHTYNMGYSGVAQHPAVPHIKKELNSRGIHKFMEDTKAAQKEIVGQNAKTHDNPTGFASAGKVEISGESPIEKALVRLRLKIKK